MELSIIPGVLVNIIALSAEREFKMTEIYILLGLVIAITAVCLFTLRGNIDNEDE